MEDRSHAYFENIDRVLEQGLKLNNKTKKELEEDILIVKTWVKSQPHLPEIPNDHTITSFLIMNKFSIENAKQKIDMYYTMRSLLPDYFENKHPLSPHMLENMDKMYCIPMPKATEEGYRIIYFRLSDENPGFDTIKYLAHSYNLTEIRMNEDYQVGDIMVFDHKHITFGDFVQVTPTFVQNYVTILEKVFNNSIKQIHLLNYPSFAEPIITLAKKLLNPKIAQRIYHHKGTETIIDFIPPKYLPKDYGGEEPSLRELNEIWKQKFADYKERFDTLDKLRVNEALRPTRLVNDDVLGYYGNFKKISVD